MTIVKHIHERGPVYMCGAPIPTSWEHLGAPGDRIYEECLACETANAQLMRDWAYYQDSLTRIPESE